MSTGATNQGQEARQLTDLLSFLHIAMKNTRLYPAGHDLVKSRIKAAHQLLTRLLAQKKTLLFGVARDTITYEGNTLGEGSAACSSFARSLSRNEIASLTFEQGVSQHSLFLFLKTAGVLPEHKTGEKTLEQELSSLNISHISIKTVNYNDFDRVQISSAEHNNKEPAGNNQPDTATWLEFTTRLTRGTLGQSDSDTNDSRESGVPGPEALAAAINANAADQSEIIQQFTLHLDQILQQEKHAQASLNGKELNTVLTSLNPQLRDQFLKTTLQQFDQNQEQSNPEKILDEFSNSLISDMLQLVSTKDVAISPTLLNLIQRLSRIRFTPGRKTTQADMSRKEFDILLEPEKYNQYVAEEYKHTLHQLSSPPPSDHAPPPGFALDQYLLTLEDKHLNRQIIRATLIFMEGTEGSTDYTELAGRLMEFSLQLPEEGAFDLLRSIARTLTRHAAEKDSTAIREAAANCLAELTTEEFLDHVYSSLLEASDEREKQEAILFFIHLGPDILGKLIKIFCMQQTVTEEDPLLLVFRKFRVETLSAIFTILPKVNEARIKKLLMLIHYLGARGAAPLLYPLLTHEDTDIQLQTLNLLLPLHDPKAFAALDSMLASNDDMLVESAIELCNTHQTVECVPALLQLLEYQFFKESAIARNRKLFLVLSRIGDNRALPALEKIAFSKWPLQRKLVNNMKQILFYSLKGYQHEDRINLVRRGMKVKDEEIHKICSALMPQQQRSKTGR